MKKIFYSLMLAALVLGASAFTGSSEGTETAEAAEQSTLIYVFEGQTLQDSLDPENWKLLGQEDQAPGCETGDFPCYVETTMSIQDWLVGKDVDDVLDDATGLRVN